MAAFEERLLALSDAETLKKAKNLLKQKTLLGVWRQSDGKLCGYFRENGAAPDVSTAPAPAPEAKAKTGGKTKAEKRQKRSSALREEFWSWIEEDN